MHALSPTITPPIAGSRTPAPEASSRRFGPQAGFYKPAPQAGAYRPAPRGRTAGQPECGLRFSPCPRAGGRQL